MSFDPPNNPKNQNFLKIRETSWFYDFTVVYHNDNHMMYGSWNIKHDIQSVLWFRAIFCPFTPLTARKIKILKKWKNSWRYYHFKHDYHKWKSYDVWFRRYGALQTKLFLILDHFLPFYTHQRAKILKKMKKITPDVLLFYNWHKCTINDNHMIYAPWHEVYQTEFICHLVQFFPLLPLPSWRI